MLQNSIQEFKEVKEIQVRLMKFKSYIIRPSNL
jgi:hypothetical protein